MRPGRAFTFVEVLIALAVVACAIIPVLTMTSTTTRKAAFSEYHVFFQARAIRLLEHFGICPYAELRRLADNPEHTIAVTLEDPPVPPEFRRKLKFCMESLTFEEVEPGLGRLTATMLWAYPLDKDVDPLKSGHRFVLSRLLADPTVSLTRREELPL